MLYLKKPISVGKYILITMHAWLLPRALGRPCSTQCDRAPATNAALPPGAERLTVGECWQGRGGEASDMALAVRSALRRKAGLVGRTP